MKLKASKPDTVIPGEVWSALDEGDRITVSVSHQIRVDGDESWVKYEAMARVREGESTEAAKTRVIDHVNAAAMEAVHKTVECVRKETA